MAGQPLAWSRDCRGRLLVVILHYGDPARTARLLAQTMEGAPPGVVRVLDNAAPRPFPAPWVRLAENRYWGGALAWALEQARQEGCSHLWFLNDDLTWRTSRPVAVAWQRLGELTSRLGRIGWYSPAFTAHPYHPQMVACRGGDFRVVRACDGVAPLLDLEAVAATGLTWADNPLGYGVDLVLSARMGDLGWPVVVDHRLVARHFFHASAGAEPGFLDRAAQLEAAFLSRHWGPDYRAVAARLAEAWEEAEG